MNQALNADTKLWYIYIIETNKGAYYTGISTDATRRFKEHCAQSAKTAKALRGRMPLKLVYCAQLNNHSDALKAEIWVKKQSKSRKILLKELSIQLPFDHLIYANADANN